MRRLRRTAGAAAAVLATALAACGGTTAPPAAPAIHWSGAPVDAEDRRHVEAVAAGLESLFPPRAARPSEEILTVTVLDDAGAYRAYRCAHSAARSESGYYDADRREVVLFLGEHFRSTAAHELSHATLRRRIPDPPPWLNEGLAEYFEYARVEDGALVVEPQRQKFARAVAWRQSDRLPALSQVLAWTRPQWRSLNGPPEFQAGSTAYSFVHFLMERPERQAVLWKTMVVLETGGSAADALGRPWPGGLAALERAWRRHLAGEPARHRLAAGESPRD
jgi:hypothetical protein